MSLIVVAFILCHFYLRNILWLTPTPPVFFRISALGVKMVKVKKNASDFEIYENQLVIPVRVEKKYGGIKEFQKAYKKWTKTRDNLPLSQV